MTRIHYVFKTLGASWGTTIIKILSLGLGLTMCCFIFARIDHDSSFDSKFKDPSTLYQLWMQFSIDGKVLDKQVQCQYPLAQACVDELPDIVESGTVLRSYGEKEFKNGENLVKGNLIVVDSTFFETMGVELLSGDPKALTALNCIYISDVAAKKYFGDEDPLGKDLYINDYQLSIKGVFRSWGEESTIPADFVGNIIEWCGNYNRSWDGGDSWLEYIRLKHKPKSAEDFNRQITTVIHHHTPPTKSISVNGLAAPIHDTYAGSEQVRHMTLTLWILGVAILLITALNYVLLCISALSHRAKAIGVHKCNGAKNGTIFGMFVIETGIILLGAMVAGAFFWWLTNRFAQETVYNNFAAYLGLDRLWIIVAVVVLIFCISALIPAKIFSNIPVTQVFRRYTEKKYGWKHALLFIEFAGAALVAGILVIVIAQYNTLINTNPGFDEDNVACVYNPSNTSEQSEAFIAALQNLPYVESVTKSNGFPGYGYSGEIIGKDAGKALFSTRFDYLGDNYIEVMGMTMLAGKFPADSSEVLINEKFAELIGETTESAVGKRITYSSYPVNISGVIKDFTTGNYYQEQQPFLGINAQKYILPWLSMRLASPARESYMKLTEALPEITGGEAPYSFLFANRKVETYKDIAQFQSLVIIAAIILMIICAIGMTGYLSDEMRRRSREIAIRKVNGATTSSVVGLICRSVLMTALPAVVTGTAIAWYLGSLWLNQFAVTLHSAAAAFILSGIGTLLLIMLVSVALTVRRASANPTENLKSE
jgi:putative ABC transport system permease protein